MPAVIQRFVSVGFMFVVGVYPQKESKMKATIRKAEYGNLKAFASVEVAPGVTLDNFKVLNGKDGLWVALPSRKDTKDGKVTYYNDIRVTPEMKTQITTAVLEAFKG